jgi:hypothetical protein
MVHRWDVQLSFDSLWSGFKLLCAAYSPQLPCELGHGPCYNALGDAWTSCHAWLQRVHRYTREWWTQTYMNGCCATDSAAIHNNRIIWTKQTCLRTLQNALGFIVEKLSAGGRSGNSDQKHGIISVGSTSSVLAAGRILRRTPERCVVPVQRGLGERPLGPKLKTGEVKKRGKKCF